MGHYHSPFTEATLNFVSISIEHAILINFNHRKQTAGRTLCSVFWILCFLVSDQYFDTAVVITGNDLLKSGCPAIDECQGKEES